MVVRPYIINDRLSKRKEAAGTKGYPHVYAGSDNQGLQDDLRILSDRYHHPRNGYALKIYKVAGIPNIAAGGWTSAL